MSGSGTRILIVEDDEQTREYLATTLEGEEWVLPVDRASTFDAGLEQLSVGPPDVMLVDLGLPDGEGVDLIRFARVHSPETLSMVITVFGDERTVVSALEAGARGYLLKSEGPEDVKRSVAQLLDGGAPISPAIASHLLRRFTDAEGATLRSSREPGLTEREREALELIVRGLTYQEVADSMAISLHTATSHIRSIYRRLEVNSRSEAVFEALSRGIVKVGRRGGADD